jgi:hypothetical protein
VALTPSEVDLLDSLKADLDTRSWDDELMLRYYLGRQRVEQLGMAIPPNMRRFLVVTNWCRTVVDTINSRQQLRSLILPGEETADPALAAIAAANNFNVQLNMFNRDRMIYGRSFLSVGANEDNSSLPFMRAESPREMVAHIDRRTEVITEAARFYGVNKGGTAAVFAITATTRPADPVTSDLVARLRTTVIPGATRGEGVTAYVGGITAAYDDLAAIISSRLPLVIGVVLALSFIVLLAAFRSVLVPLKAILCNLLAVGAAFGILTAFFQWGWGLGLIGLENAYGTVPIASYVPLIMFAVLFGMSTDYEVFLISQIFHAHAEGMDTHAAVRTGVGSSARVITAAAVIMVTVFASFVLGDIRVIKVFGIGLASAIFIDATIVRIVLVPATMELLGKANWWFPRWLEWLPRLHVEAKPDLEAELLELVEHEEVSPAR